MPSNAILTTFYIEKDGTKVVKRVLLWQAESWATFAESLMESVAATLARELWRKLVTTWCPPSWHFSSLTSSGGWTWCELGFPTLGSLNLRTATLCLTVNYWANLKGNSLKYLKSFLNLNFPDWVLSVT